MSANARVRMLRITPRKVRAVADEVRGKGVQAAIDYLTFCRKRAALPLLKLIKSAVANADRKGGMDVDSLYIKELLIDQGPTMKRWMPRARGSATPVLKRSCKISMTLDERT
ncbi:MAG: 50S ribosomal protein L22 [bacterium]